MKEDNLGFPTAIMVVVFCYTILWSAFQWGYSQGYEANICMKKRAHGRQINSASENEPREFEADVY
jgi:hypothetical protein